MTDNDSVDQYISSCIERGIMKPADIKDQAIGRMKEIDTKIAEADVLRQERQIMMGVVKIMGGDAPKPKRAAPIKDEISAQELESDYLNFAIKICNYIAENKAATARELMKICGISVENDHQAYNTIKWLCANGICSRNDSHEIVIGPAWSDRPIAS